MITVAVILLVVTAVIVSVQEARKMGVGYLDFWRHWLAEFRYGQQRDRFVVVLRADTSEFDRAMREAQRAIGKFGQTLGHDLLPALRNLGRAFSRLMLVNPDIALVIAQNKHGAGNRVPETGAWRSDMCSAWVHGSCPGLNCDCRCHR